MSNRIIGVIGLILIVAFVAFTVPAIVDGVPGDAQTTTTIDEGDSEVVTEHLEIANIEATGSDAEIRATNLRTGTAESATITEGETETFELDNETVTVTVTDAVESKTTITVEYPRTFGWDDSALWLADNLDIIVVATAFAAIMGGLMVVVRP